jgi:predicted DNA-binding transcriptional regulator AlpA
MRDAPWEHDQGEKPKGIGDCTAANLPACMMSTLRARLQRRWVPGCSRSVVLAIDGVSYPTLWSMMRAGTSPRSRVVGGKSMWSSSEIEPWLAALPVRQLKGDEPKARRSTSSA